MAPSATAVSNGHPNGHADGHTNGANDESTNEHPSGRANGYVDSNAQQRSDHRFNGARKHSNLCRFDNDVVQDLVCVGFGPASLAIAVALHDAIEGGDSAVCRSAPKVRFLEKQERFAWHAGMLLPGAKMQITFIKDLATLRNPRSHFTFLNYLHKQGRLVQFTNLSTFLPQRIEYEQYMRWCAEHFEDVVDYSQKVERVEVDETNRQTGAVGTFKVTSMDTTTGLRSTIRARHVCIAVGGAPNIPKCLDRNHPRVIHSSQYATSVTEIFSAGIQPRSVAVIGSGQSAAEVFNNVPSRFPGAKAYLLIRGAALRPSDDSPFVNEIFDPWRVDDVYSQRPAIRAEGIARDRGTNYSVVRLELLEEIYSHLYSQRIQSRSEEEWPQRILTHRTVTGMSGSQDGNGVRLHIRNDSGDYQAHERSGDEDLEVDLVVVASGYRRDIHEWMLEPIKHLLPNSDRTCSVNRDYSIKFREGALEQNVGVWLQGCNESTHGLADSLLSILATRGGEMVDNIFGGDAGDSNGVKKR